MTKDENVSVSEIFHSPFKDKFNIKGFNYSPIVEARMGNLSTWLETKVYLPIKQNDEFNAFYGNGANKDVTLTDLFRYSFSGKNVNNNFEEDKTPVNSFIPLKDKLYDKNETLTKRFQLNNTKSKFSFSDSQKGDSEINNDMEQNTRGKKKINKGLKLLSVVVRNIVIDQKSVTYKEVADIIMQDIIKYEKTNPRSFNDISKEEQNIKRRVYDALNVLIASGILLKEGKKVSKNFNNKKIKVSMKRMDINTLKTKTVN